MDKIDYTPEEAIIHEAISYSRKVQDYIWDRELNFINGPFNPDQWADIFQKRVIKIFLIKKDSPNYKTELRKRVLQQAALSILALRVLDGEEVSNV